MLVLGDAHASKPKNLTALMDAYEATTANHALQVGDLQHYSLPVPTWFVAGNNEDFDVIDTLRSGEPTNAITNAHLLDSNSIMLEGIRVAGLSGNFAPTRFEKSRSELSDDRRRHFVSADVERVLDLDGVDVFLTHEAPHGLLEEGGYDVGCKHVDRILKQLEPDLCLVGHHHQHAESTFGPTRVISLAPVWETGYRLDTETLGLDRIAVE